jgi:hypothetical protein
MDAEEKARRAARKNKSTTQTDQDDDPAVG